MSNRYLALLVQNRKPWAFGDDGKPKIVTQILPDFTTQSPRLYSALSNGGGVVFVRSVAASLVAAGYDVTTFRPTSAERSYLLAIDKRFSGELWLATCEGRAVKDQGQVRCFPLPGLLTVSEADARESGATSRADEAPAKRWVENISGWRYFTSSAASTPALVQKALSTVALWDQIAEKVEEVERAWSVSGLPMPPSIKARQVRAVSWLAQTAQPVAMVKKVYPQPAKMSGQSFGWEPTTTTIIVAVVVLGIVAGLAYVAYQGTQAAAINKEMQDAYNETVAPFVRCVADTSLTNKQRAACQQALNSLDRPEAPPTVLEQLTELAPWIAGIGGLLFASYYIGPVLREVSETGAVGIQRFRQSRMEG
jgi:hypothetical protein